MPFISSFNAFTLYNWAADSKQLPFPYLTRFPHKPQWIQQDTSEHVTLARLSFRSTIAVLTALPAMNCPRPYPLPIKRCRTGLGSAASQGARFRLSAMRFLACCFATYNVMIRELLVFTHVAALSFSPLVVTASLAV
jgi:hypothetical protein